MRQEKEQDRFPEEFIRYFQGLSEADLRTRPYARRFYHDVLIPKLKAGEEISAAALKELIADYQRGKQDANFDLVTLHGFAYIDYASRHNAKYRLSPQSDPAGYKAAKRADELITELLEMEESQKKEK